MLPRMIPPGIAFEMLYLGEYIGMEDARRWGMVNRVVPRGEPSRKRCVWRRRFAKTRP